MTIFQAESGDAGSRADVFLASRLPELSRSAVQRLLTDGFVTKNGVFISKNYRIAQGDTLTVMLPEPRSADAVPQQIALDIAYEDSDVIVVNKPRGMVVHPAPGHSDGTLVNALLYHCAGGLSGIGGTMRPGIVHRIDMNTSGLLIVAKNDFAHASLSNQLQSRSLSRVYETVTRGALPEDSGTIDAPVGRHPVHRKRQAVTEKNSRDAVTHYEVIARYPGYTHARCRLETGRTHQIRVHMAHIGHPVLGDELYGGRDPGFPLGGQCLHARELRFSHPRTGELVRVDSELPEYFCNVLEKLRRL